MKSALTTIGLALALLGGGAARAGQIVNTTFLSDFTVQVVPGTTAPNYFNISFVGVFLVPEVPSGLRIQNADVLIDYDFGISSWSQNVAGNIYGGHFNGGAGWSFSPSVGWIDKYGTFNSAEGPAWQAAVSDKHRGPGGPVDIQLSADGPYAVGGYVPFYLNP